MTDDGKLVEAADRKATRRLRDYREWRRRPKEPLIPEDEGRELEFAWGDAWDMGHAAAAEAQAERIEKLEAALEQIEALRLRGMETEAQSIARQALQANQSASEQ